MPIYSLGFCNSAMKSRISPANVSLTSSPTTTASPSSVSGIDVDVLGCLAFAGEGAASCSIGGKGAAANPFSNDARLGGGIGSDGGGADLGADGGGAMM